MADFLTKTLRRRPPPSPPAEDIAYWERNLDRFSAVAPHILKFESLAGELNDAARRRVFNGFKANVSSRLLWDTVKGW